MKLKNKVTTVNTETGEIIETHKTFSIKTTTELFYITYINTVGERLKITRITDRNILECLCCRANYNTGVVNISKKVKDDICEQIQIKSQTYFNGIQRLKKLKMIEGTGGTYTISPLIFWKGSEDERAKLIKANKLSYTINFEPPVTGMND